MNNTTTVYGCSDDLIELDGTIYEEFNFYDVPVLLMLNNGVRLWVEYTKEGIWRIESLNDSPLVVITKAEDHPAWTGPDGELYSDRAEVTGATTVKAKKFK